MRPSISPQMKVLLLMLLLLSSWHAWSNTHLVRAGHSPASRVQVHDTEFLTLLHGPPSNRCDAADYGRLHTLVLIFLCAYKGIQAVDKKLLFLF